MNGTSPDDVALPGVNAALLQRLLRGERAQLPSRLAERDLAMVLSAGFCVENETIWLDRTVDKLDAVVIRTQLSARAMVLWPDFRVQDTVGSTNAELMALGIDAAGRALTTEFQSGGRGRRGRTWISPVGCNLAVSLGWQQEGGVSQFAGLSLVVGLAVVDALRTLGLADVYLKWPNDILLRTSSVGGSSESASGSGLEFSKLGGILVELQQHANRSVAVIGIGLNQGGAALTRPHVEQPLGDLQELDPELSRNQVLASVVNALADYLEQFSQTGFAPMVAVWESLHAYAGREVNVLRGTEVIAGRVLGVAEGGELRVATAAGEQRFDAGEVSLRVRQNDV